MKVVSWNVRGLGGFEKRKEVRSLVTEKRPWILCLQETKLQRCDDDVCRSLWDGQLAAVLTTYKFFGILCRFVFRLFQVRRCVCGGTLTRLGIGRKDVL